MKYLNKFYNYIKESKILDIDEVKSTLYYINDLGFTTNLRTGTLVDFGGDEYIGRKYISIYITLDGLKFANLMTNYPSKFIDDSKFWDLLDEILSLRGRLIDLGLATNCLIDFSNKRDGYMPYISLTLVGDKDENWNKLIELERRLLSKLNSMRSDFSYGTLIELRGDHIYIKSDSFGYTHRKLNNLINRSIEGSELSISDFSIEKNQNSETGDWNIKITIKK
jgi:hypothetical protein